MDKVKTIKIKEKIGEITVDNYRMKELIVNELPYANCEFVIEPIFGEDRKPIGDKITVYEVREREDKTTREDSKWR